MMVRCD